MTNDNRAKIFISCGQKKGTDEVEIAKSIATALEKHGFESYIAVEDQNLKSLKEVVFKELSSSEYFLFIDFKREQIDGVNFRGSLFSHQELAIASFRDIKFLGFQEKGVELGGVLKSLQGNCSPFDDRNKLLNIVLEKIKKEGWKPDWKNQLSIERVPDQFTDAYTKGRYAFFFHINVKNLNPYEHAKNCYSFVEEIKDLKTGKIVRPDSIELKWAGYTKPNTTILPNSLRKLDGFFVFHSKPSVAHFNLFTDSTEFNFIINTEGNHDITYLVVSDNFPAIRKTLRLHLSTNIKEVKLEDIK